MKLHVLASVVALGAYSSAVFAQNEGTFYLGAKVGSMEISVEDEPAHIEDLTARGFVAGYDFGSGAALELEINNTSKGAISANGLQSGEVKIDTKALYFAYRSQGTAFFKLKAGLLSENVEVEACGFTCADAEGSDSGISLGIGGGFNMGDVVQAEVEYTIIEQDVDYLSLGLNFRF